MISLVVAVSLTVGTNRIVASRTRTTVVDKERSRRAIVAAEAGRLNGWFGELSQQCASLATLLGPFSGNAKQALEARSSLDRSEEALPGIDSGSYIVGQGSRVIASDSKNAPLAGQQRSGAFIDQATGGTASISPLIRDPLLRNEVIAAGHPLAGGTGKERHDALVCTRAVKSLYAHASSGGPASSLPGVKESIFDANRQAIVAGRAAKVEEADLGTSHAARAKRDGASTVIRVQGDGGVPTVAAIAGIGSSGWTVAITEDAATFDAGNDSPVLAATLAAALIALLSAIAATWLFRRLLAARLSSEAAKRSFLAIAGHELRTPLAVIRGFGQTLVGRWEKVPDAQRKEIIETIYHQSRNLEHLVERLLLGAHLEAGFDAPANVRPVDVGRLLTEVVEHHSRLAKLHEVVLDAPEGLIAEADPKALEQAFTNVVENAIKFSPAGGKVLVSAARQGKRIVVTVDDEGVGLPADDTRIFEKFSQSEAVETRVNEEGGVGLGLFIARTLLAKFSGTIQAHRRQPNGTRFVITVHSE